MIGVGEVRDPDTGEVIAHVVSEESSDGGPVVMTLVWD